MTTFMVPNAAHTIIKTVWHDDRLRDPSMRYTTYGTAPMRDPWADAMLWPSSRMCCGDPSMDPMYLFGVCNLNVARWGHMNLQQEASGNAFEHRFRGTTRDSSGNPVGGCTILVFRSSDNVLVGTSVSDANGYYEAFSSNPAVNHYLVVYHVGTPDTGGTTTNTLQPSAPA